METVGPSHFTWGIGRSEEYLQDLCQHIDQHYERITQEKTGGGERVIHKPSGRLAAVQEEIHDTFLRKPEWPYWLFGAGDGKAQRENAEAHIGLKHHLVTDIYDFYPSVSNQEIFDVYIHKLDFAPPVASIATRLTTYEGGLPQGAPTSSRLADLAFLDVDRVLISFCESHDIVYTRYADDMTFSAGHCFKSEIPNIKSIVDEKSFRLHREKTGYKKGPIEVTGVVVTNNDLFAPPRLKRRLDRIDPESDEWEGTFGYVQHIEPNFEKAEISSVKLIGLT